MLKTHGQQLLGTVLKTWTTPAKTQTPQSSKETEPTPLLAVLLQLGALHLRVRPPLHKSRCLESGASKWRKTQDQRCKWHKESAAEVGAAAAAAAVGVASSRRRRGGGG